MGEAAPRRKEAGPRARPVWHAVAERVQAVLADSVRWTGGKQRLTATRLHEVLLAEGKRVDVTVVKEAVAEWKRQRREVFVPLTYRPGDLTEVDFFEVLVDVDGTRRKAWLFLMRLMYSGRSGTMATALAQRPFLHNHGLSDPRISNLTTAPLAGRERAMSFTTTGIACAARYARALYSSTPTAADAPFTRRPRCNAERIGGVDGARMLPRLGV